MVKAKDGEIVLKGTRDVIFTDVVRLVDAFCTAGAKFGIHNATAALLAVVIGVEQEGDANINYKMMIDVLTNMEENKNE